jgi:hypothetical protein
VTLEVNFASEVIYWRGPSPFYFLRVPEAQATAITNISKQVSYGWGVIPCDVKIGIIEFYTALFPKDGSYLVPLKKSVREAAAIDLGERVEVNIRIRSGL